MKKRRLVRRPRYVRPEREAMKKHSKWKEGWFRYREIFDSILPPPTLLVSSESEGSIDMALVKLPALLLYTPLYYLLLVVFAILLYPWIALFS